MANLRFVRGDVDGFFGLFVDNLLQLMLIILLGPLCGMPAAFTVGVVLPGAAVSLLVGNLFYAWQARRLARETGRADVTALPYGINTVSLIAFVFLVMGPVYEGNKAAMGEAGAGRLAWQVGLYGTMVCAVMEIAGAFVADWVRRNTPRAALLSALAGIAITFIAMGFIFRLFANPLLAIVPLFIILVAYAGRVKLPLGLPAGLVAIVVGTLIAWVARACGHSLFEAPPISATPGIYLPRPAVGDAFALILFGVVGLKYMAICDFSDGVVQHHRVAAKSGIGGGGGGSVSDEAVAAGEWAGFAGGGVFWVAVSDDDLHRASGLESDGAQVVGVFNDERGGDHAALFVGGIGAVLHVVPIDVTLGILLWIGIIITAQAFQEVPKSHALAVAVGLIPAAGGVGVVSDGDDGAGGGREFVRRENADESADE